MVDIISWSPQITYFESSWVTVTLESNSRVNHHLHCSVYMFSVLEINLVLQEYLHLILLQVKIHLNLTNDKTEVNLHLMITVDCFTHILLIHFTNIIIKFKLLSVIPGGVGVIPGTAPVTLLHYYPGHSLQWSQHVMIAIVTDTGAPVDILQKMEFPILWPLWCINSLLLGGNI